jgi:hypothetical protein
MLWCSFTPVTPLGCALTINASVSALEYALTKSLDLKPPEMNSYKKTWGAPRCLGGLRLLIGVISVTCGCAARYES